MVVHLRVGYGIYFKHPVGTDVYVVLEFIFCAGVGVRQSGVATWLRVEDAGIVFRFPAFANVSLFPKHPDCF